MNPPRDLPEPPNWLMATLASIGVLILINLASHDKRAANATASADPATIVRGMCMLHIKQTLHDPGSAEFDHSSSTNVTRAGNIWIVQRPVRARNEYNAVRRGVFECQYQQHGTDYTLISLKQIN